MSKENVELIKSIQPPSVDLVEMFPGDSPAAADALTDLFGGFFTDGFTVQFIAENGMDTPQFRGVDGLLEAWRDWLDPWESYELETEEYIDAGDDVVVMVRIRGRTARDGVLVEHAPAAVWTIRDGKVAAVRFYLRRDEALRAAGLDQR
jgi:ketosteroid isomerase-like protein